MVNLVLHNNFIAICNPLQSHASCMFACIGGFPSFTFNPNVYLSPLGRGSHTLRIVFTTDNRMTSTVSICMNIPGFREIYVYMGPGNAQRGLTAIKTGFNPPPQIK